MEKKWKTLDKNTNPANCCRICTYFLTCNRLILITGFAGSRWRHHRFFFWRRGGGGYGKANGLFVMSFPTYPQKRNVFSVYTSFINTRMNVNVRKSCGETNFVHIFIPYVHFKQKSEVSAAKNYLSQRLQRLFPIVLEKGSFYSRTAIRWSARNSTLDKKIDPVSCTYQPPHMHGAFVATQSRN